MKVRLILYVLLVLFVFMQITLMKYVPWVPDIILLMVVFAGIFRGGVEGAGVGLAAGLLRGCFSVGTSLLDIFLFPAVGVMSSLLAGVLYWQNPFSQMFITAAAAFMVIAGHAFYLNFSGGNDVGVFFPVMTSWKCVLSTVCVAPFLFAFLKKILLLKEQNITKIYTKK